MSVQNINERAKNTLKDSPNISNSVKSILNQTKWAKKIPNSFEIYQKYTEVSQMCKNVPYYVNCMQKKKTIQIYQKAVKHSEVQEMSRCT